MGAGTVVDRVSAGTESGWARLDHAAVGIVYGSILVLSVLMAVGDHAEVPLETAVVLFGSTLAVALAKAFSELLSRALDTRERMTREAWWRAWAHSRPTLVTANLSTAMFILAGLGAITTERAVTVSQIICVGFLIVLGARVGWVLERTVVSAVLGAVFVGGVGLMLAVLKHVIH
jgi:hypothetical protein